MKYLPISLQRSTMTRPEKLPNGIFLLFFAALSVLFRFMTFHFSVIDHDESTYLVIAQQMLKGKALYVDFWDVKPPGIFLIFASLIGIFGNYVEPVRLMTALVIGFTAYFIYLAALRWGKERNASLVAGFAYVILACVHKWNLAVNTEVYFSLFTAIGLFLFLGKKNPLNLFLTGLVFGLGFIIKYFVLFDLLALWVFYLVLTLKGRPRNITAGFIWNTLALGAGFVIPFGLIVLYYFASGHLHEFVFVSLVFPGRYTDEFSLVKAMNFFLEFHMIYAPAVALAFTILISRRDRELTLLGTIWLALVWLIILVPGKHFSHYYHQLLVPLSFVLCGLSFSGSKVERFIHAHCRPVLITILMALLAWNLSLQYRFFGRKPDIVREAADYLERRLTDDDIIYCNTTTVIYFLLDKSPPTRFVHTSLLYDRRHIEAVGLDADKEYRDVFSSDPAFIVIQYKVVPLVQDYLGQFYELERVIAGEIKIYRRKPSVSSSI